MSQGKPSPSPAPARRGGIASVATIVLILALLLLRSFGRNGGQPASQAGATPLPAPATQGPTSSSTQSASDADAASLPTAKQSAVTTPTAARSPAATTRPATTTATVRPPIAGEESGLPTIAYARLPAEAQTTLRLIDAGGPFPFAQDGVSFQNREGILPAKPRGYYHEYTVITPGEGDRGARRIVQGAQGDLYYTDDHYNSFRVIVR